MSTFTRDVSPEEFKAIWANRAAFLAYTLYMSLGAVAFLIALFDPSRSVLLGVTVGFWFFALFIAVGSFWTNHKRAKE